MAYHEYIQKIKKMSFPELIKKHKQLSKEIKKEEKLSLGKRDYSRLMALQAQHSNINLQIGILKAQKQDEKLKKKLR